MVAQAATFLIVATAAAASVTAAQEAAMIAPGPARVIRQDVRPAEYRGACPATLRLIGVIDKGGWGPVEFHWQMSDGTRTASQRHEFDVGEPPKEVTMNWRVDARPGHEVWATIVITEPANTANRAPRAVARVTCNEPPARDACEKIDEAGPIGSLVRECAEFRYREAQRELDRLLLQFRQSLGERPADAAAGDSAAQADAKRHGFFQTAQDEWEAYRRNSCEEAYYEFWPGSMAATAKLDCLTELTASRAAYLRRRLSDDET